MGVLEPSASVFKQPLSSFDKPFSVVIIPLPFKMVWPVESYVDEDGIVHYLTADDQPPAGGWPMPPDHELEALLSPLGVPPLPNSNALTTAPANRSGALAPRQPATFVASTPQLIPIGTYIFQPVIPPVAEPPTQFVNIHFIGDGVRPHRDRFTGRNRDDNFPYTVCLAATSMTMKDLIKAFEGGGALGFTECKQMSDGRSWAEVQTFKLNDDNSGKTLAELGWTESRGVDEPPVWVCAYFEGLDEQEEKSYWEKLGFPES